MLIKLNAVSIDAHMNMNIFVDILYVVFSMT